MRRALEAVLGGMVIVLLVMACEPMTPLDLAPRPPEPKPEAPLPVVSFVTLGHSTTAGRTVLLTIDMAPPASEPVSIRFKSVSPPVDWPPVLVSEDITLSESSVTVPEGSSRVFIPVPIPYYPAIAGETLGTNILIEPGEGYIRGYPNSHGLKVYYDPDYNPEPDPEYAKEPHPLFNKKDDRCSYAVGMSSGGSWVYPVMLLDRVSSAGTLCATGTYNVRQGSLDRVSKASTAMLQYRPDITERLTVKSFGDFILLYAKNEEDWCDPPAFPEFYMNTIGWCDKLRFSLPIGTYAGSIILCPEFNLRICVHEVAHAVYFALFVHDSNEREPVQKRFEEPDVVDLWSGYAIEDDWEFFAEMSAIYFCVPAGGVTLPVLHCASELQAHDPKTYEVIHAIYQGSSDLRQVLR